MQQQLESFVILPAQVREALVSGKMSKKKEAVKNRLAYF